MRQPDGRVAIGPAGRVLAEPRLWVLAYGEWTGSASATLAGVARAARDTVQQVAQGSADLAVAWWTWPANRRMVCPEAAEAAV